MWANPWPGGTNPMMQQSAYQGIPHGQIDWAELAKQWIQHKETADNSQPTPDTVNKVNLGRPPPPPPPMPTQGDDMEVVNEEENSQESNSFQGPPTGWNWNMQWNSQGWGMQHPTEENKDGTTFDYNHGGYGEQYEYNHGGQFYDQGMGDQGEYNNQYWNEEEQAPQHHHHHHREPRNRRDRDRFRHNDDSNASDDSGIDAAKRKNLPAWIREGLEKMENEKQKKLQKEKYALEMKELEKQREEKEKAAKEAILAQKEGNDSEPSLPKKSRFESDDELSDRSRSPSRGRSPEPSPIKKRSPSPDEFKTEEEKQMEMMIKVKKTLTEVLLEVTNNEILDIAREVYNKAKTKAAKAPAKQLAKSTALASITGLGLGYGSDSEEEEEDEDNIEDKGSDGGDSDVELAETIRRKKREFEEKMRNQAIYEEDEMGKLMIF